MDLITSILSCYKAKAITRNSAVDQLVRLCKVPYNEAKRMVDEAVR